MELLRFIFSEVYIFFGVLILLCIFFEGIATIVSAFKGGSKE